MDYDKIFESINLILQKAIQHYNLSIIEKNNGIKKDTIVLKNYSRQYMSVINIKNEKLVWVNCFCTSNGHSTWPNAVIVSKGGNCYFNLMINLNDKSYSNLKFNESN